MAEAEKKKIGKLAMMRRKTKRMAELRTPTRQCSPEAIVSIRFACGCRLQLKEKQVTLILPKDPAAGNRKRYLGHVDEAQVLHIHRDGRDFLRARQMYGLNVHLLLSAQALSFDRVYCDTPARGGFLPPLDELLQRKQFQYAKAGFEVQVGFRLADIRGAA